MSRVEFGQKHTVLAAGAAGERMRLALAANVSPYDMHRTIENDQTLVVGAALPGQVGGPLTVRQARQQQRPPSDAYHTLTRLAQDGTAPSQYMAGQYAEHVYSQQTPTEVQAHSIHDQELFDGDDTPIEQLKSVVRLHDGYGAGAANIANPDADLVKQRFFTQKNVAYVAKMVGQQLKSRNKDAIVADAEIVMTPESTMQWMDFVFHKYQHGPVEFLLAETISEMNRHGAQPQIDMRVREMNWDKRKALTYHPSLHLRRHAPISLRGRNKRPNPGTIWHYG